MCKHERGVMKTCDMAPGSVGLDQHGITEPGEVFWNLPVAALYEHALRAREGVLASSGALLCVTGEHTGRSPQDRYIVEDEQTAKSVHWGAINRKMSEADFDRLHQRMIRHFRGRRLYVRDMYAGADEAHRVPIRIVNEFAWQNLFARQLFVRPENGAIPTHEPQFTVLCAPTCLADPATDGTRTSTFIVLNLSRGLVLIGGTMYAGEIKKSIFSIMNYVWPLLGVPTMHCSANIGTAGDVALFFGLSGTGKTTLSADPERGLIGDDEHGWGENGVFNIEGGCYAKCIRLSRENEPQIYDAIRFGAVLENVVVDPETRKPDYEADSLTENTRAAYPIDHINNAVLPSVGGHPRNVVFLACDAFGVLPPISKLSPEQAMYHFLSGYTAKVAGTERGVTAPQTTFSACFGAPFLPLPPERYALMLGERLARHKVRCWLVNTGWSGGPCGEGERIKLRYTRAMVRAALSGALDKGVAFEPHPVFGVAVPQTCPEVPKELLNPRNTWRDGLTYDAKARELARRFVENFRGFERIAPEVAGAGPQPD
jgi:phosphoenolpyruvate carboxykinase (ATP)